jgi:hypothetical protein
LELEIGMSGHYEPVMAWVEDDDEDEEYLDEYLEEQQELSDLAEVEDCRCGAKRIGSDGRLSYVADCCC